MAMNDDMSAPLSVKCFVDELLERCWQCRILQAGFFIYLVEPRRQKWMSEDRFACYSVDVLGPILAFTFVVVHCLEPSGEIEEIHILRSRLHMMPTMVEA